MWRILCRILSMPHNVVLDMNNVMKGRYAENGENKLISLEGVAWNLCNSFLKYKVEEMMHNIIYIHNSVLRDW